MWRLEKPSLQKAKEDLKIIVEHCRDIGNEHIPDFEKLYDEYNRQKGSISEGYHLDFLRNHSVQANAMYGQYRKLREKQNYSFIREELSENANTCPYCGFGEPVTLDHYMPESDYQELATCRLNLVPICWKCNHKKHDKDYHGFTHAYYQDFPANVIFFKCMVEANADGCVCFNFYIDSQNLDNILVAKLRNQIEVIDLSHRLNKECITYITSNFNMEYFDNNKSLKFFISDRLTKTKECFGNNDWHSALLKGLYDCNEFDVTCLNNFLNRHKRIVLV